MVCSALIKDEKQQQIAAPTDKQGAGWLWCRRSSELIQIQGSGLPMTEGTADTENKIPCTAGNPSSSTQPHHKAPSKYLLGGTILLQPFSHAHPRNLK